MSLIHQINPNVELLEIVLLFSGELALTGHHPSGELHIGFQVLLVATMNDQQASEDWHLQWFLLQAEFGNRKSLPQ